MTERLFEQARQLYETIELMKLRIAGRMCAAHVDDGKGRAVELTLAQMNSLRVVRDRDQVSVKELAEALRVSAPSASAMVERLVDMDLVTREQSQTDRREVVVRLTAKGTEVVDHMERVMLQSIVELLDKVGPEYAEMWCTLYARIREVIENDETPAISEVRNTTEHSPVEGKR
jgi:DNA-binding MarR family transcriptional regulator